MGYHAFDNLDFENLLIEDEHGFGFKKEEYNPENVKNSAILQYYITLREMLKKEQDAYETDILGELGYKFSEWGGNVGTWDLYDLWFNEDTGIFLKVSLSNNRDGFDAALLTYNKEEEITIFPK